MIYIETGSMDVYYNFGLEYYFTAEKKLPEPVFLFWRTTPTLMVGKYQNILEEINKPYADAHHIHLVRRLSGGGTIYTDPGGWQFSFIIQENDTQIHFQRYLRPILDALHELGIPAEFNGRNDLLVNGRKFSGNAQYRLAGATVHHGSLLYQTDIEQMAAATTVDEYKILSKSIKSVRDRVINLSDCLPEPLTPEEFKSAIVSSVIKNGQFYELTDEDKVRIRQLGEEKFHSWESIYGFSPRFSIQREAHLKGGLFHTDLNIKKGRITEIDFSGDFFSAVDLESLKKALTGCRYQKQDVQNIIEKTVGNGIYEISPKDMANVIVV